MFGLEQIPNTGFGRMHRDGRIFPTEISLPQTTHGTGHETTTGEIQKGGRLPDIYGELSEVLCQDMVSTPGT